MTTKEGLDLNPKMPRAVLNNGGVVIRLKAHAVCANCTHYDEVEADPESCTLERFADAAYAKLSLLGWKVGTTAAKTGRTLCPNCA